MTVKEYLNQAYRLEQRINLSQLEIERLNELATSISGVGYGEKVMTSKSTDASFEKIIIRIMEMEEKEGVMLDELLAFKNELKSVIEAIENKDERLVMHYRYFCNMRWTQIADKLECDARTIKRWHNKAIAKIRIPDNPTIIDKNLKKTKIGM